MTAFLHSKLITAALAALGIFFSCSCSDNIASGEGDGNDGKTEIDMTPNPEARSYMDMYDAISDAGQYYMPETSRIPAKHWTCVDVETRGDRNETGKAEHQYGLQYHLLAQSLAGLVNRAMDEGRTDVGIWLEVNGEGYAACKQNLGPELGRQTAIELCTKTYAEGNVRDLIDGYVLTDVVNNPESNEVATVAAHVYNSIIVDVRDEAIFKDAGYELKYDARAKSTEDAWREFRDKCSNKALVVMPVQTGELREFAIKNRLFCFNLNKRYGTTDGGQNNNLFDEVLSWLVPNAPVLGWENGVAGEDVFVGKVSRYGKLMLAADWSYNHSLTSAGARQNQEQVLAGVINPRDIDYDKHGNFTAFFLSDGDNYQWTMGDGFVNDFYTLPTNETSCMSYGLCSQAMSELAPVRFRQLYSLQNSKGTLMECFGGGYFYVDTYAEASADRKGALRQLAERTAAHMRQHRLKVLHLMAMSWDSSAAREAYQAFVDANDQLEGIVTIQYDPYSAGGGRVLWCTNRNGYDIPVVSAKYALWKDASSVERGIGNPKEVAQYIRDNEVGSDSYDAIVVHAWSDFSGYRSAAAAAACIRQAPSSVVPVSIQELIWRIRMAKRREQTIEILKTIR